MHLHTAVPVHTFLFLHTYSVPVVLFSENPKCLEIRQTNSEQNTRSNFHSRGVIWGGSHNWYYKRKSSNPNVVCIERQIRQKNSDRGFLRSERTMSTHIYYILRSEWTAPTHYTRIIFRRINPNDEFTIHCVVQHYPPPQLSLVQVTKTLNKPAVFRGHKKYLRSNQKDRHNNFFFLSSGRLRLCSPRITNFSLHNLENVFR